jgi:hypothetical protein
LCKILGAQPTRDLRGSCRSPCCGSHGEESSYTSLSHLELCAFLSFLTSNCALSHLELCAFSPRIARTSRHSSGTHPGTASTGRATRRLAEAKPVGPTPDRAIRVSLAPEDSAQRGPLTPLTPLTDAGLRRIHLEPHVLWGQYGGEPAQDSAQCAFSVTSNCALSHLELRAQVDTDLEPHDISSHTFIGASMGGNQRRTRHSEAPCHDYVGYLLSHTMGPDVVYTPWAQKLYTRSDSERLTRPDDI